MSIDTIINLIRTGEYDDLEALNADRRTWQPIDRRELRGRFVVFNLDEATHAILADPESPAELQTLARKTREVVGSDLDTVRTNVTEYANAFAQVAGGWVQAGVLTLEQVADVYALGGGLRVPSPISQQDYDAALAQMARQSAADAVIAAAYAYAESVQQVANLHVNHAEVELPTVPEPVEVPEVE